MRRDFAGRGYFGPLMKYVRGIGGSPSPPHFLKRIYANLRSDIRDNPIRRKITPLTNICGLLWLCGLVGSVTSLNCNNLYYIVLPLNKSIFSWSRTSYRARFPTPVPLKLACSCRVKPGIHVHTSGSPLFAPFFGRR